MNSALNYTIFPVLATVVGTALALYRRPSENIMRKVHHFTAGVVFAATTTEILPDLKRQSILAILLGGFLGIAFMLYVRLKTTNLKGPIGLLTAVGIDILIDGLVLGIAFAVGEKTGALLTLALTLEIFFLGMSITTELNDFLKRRALTFLIVLGLTLMLPLGSFLGSPVASLGFFWLTTLLTFSLVALLYLVTEELLVEAHEGGSDTPMATAMFFIGFLLLLMIEELG